MQVCKKCGAEIKYIAINSEDYAIVEPEIVEVYTENGHKHRAYVKHKCKNGPEKINVSK